MNKIELFKRFGDGAVRSVKINETKANMSMMLSSGYYLTKAEAEAGKVIEAEPEQAEPEQAEPAKPAAKKPAAKK